MNVVKRKSHDEGKKAKQAEKLYDDPNRHSSGFITKGMKSSEDGATINYPKPIKVINL